MCGILFTYGVPLSQAQQGLETLKGRGPDASKIITRYLKGKAIHCGFTRLAIMDLSDKGMQPFTDDRFIAMCNGEIYNHLDFDVVTDSQSDCSIILPMLREYSFYLTINNFDGEFAVIVFDTLKKCIHVARDRYGVRPLFYAHNEDMTQFGFASELKALVASFGDGITITPLDPSCYYKHDFKYLQSFQNGFPGDQISPRLPVCPLELNKLLTASVKKRLFADTPGPLGFLLSGGLDSSLIVAIACRILGPDAVVCFTTGAPDSSDVIASKKVVDFLGIKNHHIVDFSSDEGVKAIEEVVRVTETYDVTTVRASTPQFLMAKYIAKQGVKVVLSGEGSDEITGGYRYFKSAPDADSFREETIRLTKDLYLFDNLRTDRTLASQGLEVRVPFLDHAFVSYVLDTDPQEWFSARPEKKPLRDAFVGYLPDEILYRGKEAFSDAVSSQKQAWRLAVADGAKEEGVGSEKEWYRAIFDKHYSGHSNVIPYMWMPKWQDESVTDPSATVLNVV